ncbi:MAG TPA: hypothetical protein VLN74_15595 [Ilumatobacteraceae bacterium]|nr:hypothetical protein [Ilumatobacteraceae bacterium]
MTPLDILQLTSPILNEAGNRFYFHPDTLATGKELGLDGFRFYFLGRGGVLGDVEPAVVVAAFGYFSPGVVEAIWSSAKQIMAPREAARAYLGCADRLGIERLDGLDGLDGFNDAAEAMVAAVDRSALPLFAGVAAEPLPDHPAARAYRNVVILRELRGSVHLLSIVATGVSPSVAHAIRRPGDVATFGWEPGPDVSDDDRARLGVADELTDRLLVPAIETLTDAQRDAFVTGVELIGAHLA